MKVKVIDIDEISKYQTFEETINEFIKDKKSSTLSIKAMFHQLLLIRW